MMELTLTQVLSPTLSDFQNIALYPHQKAHTPSTKNIIRDYIFSRESDSPPYQIYAIIGNARPVGVMTLQQRTDDYLWLGGFQVDKDFQALGTGKRVMHAVFNMVMKSLTLKGLMLDVCESNLAAIVFYQSLGLSLQELALKDNQLLWIMKIEKNTIGSNLSTR